MGAINTEEAAKRLARVILSDIELYSRERPQAGETLEAQIEEGRRLFGTRVTPALAPLFSVVLADRQTAANTTQVVAASSAQAGAAVSVASNDEQPTPGPRVASQALDHQPTPGPNVSASVPADKVVVTRPIRRVAARVPPAAPKTSGASLSTAAKASPASVRAEAPAPARLVPAPVPVPEAAAPIAALVSPHAFVPAAAAALPEAVPPLQDIPVPRLTSRFSILKLLAALAAVAATAAFLVHFVR